MFPHFLKYYDNRSPVEQIRARNTFLLNLLVLFAVILYIINHIIIASPIILVYIAAGFFLVCLVPLYMLSRGWLIPAINLLLFMGTLRIIQFILDSSHPYLMVISGMLVFFVAGLMVIRRYQLAVLMTVAALSLPAKLFLFYQQNQQMPERFIAMIFLYYLSLSVILIARYVTEQETESLTRFRSNEGLIQKMFNTTPDAIRLIDLDYNIILSNRQYRMLNNSVEKIDNATCGSGNNLDHTCTVRRIAAGNDIVEKQIIAHTEAGKCHLNLTALPIRDERGKVSSVLEVFRDITDHIEQTRKLKQLKEAAETANQAKSAFLARMSHELRTPLNAIIGFSSLLESDEKDPERQENLRHIKAAGKNLLALISDILDLSRIEAGTIVLEKENFSPRGIVEELNSIFSLQANNKNLVFETDVYEDVPKELFGDPRRLEQVISNLLGNAIKFTREGSVTLTVTSGKQEDARHYLSFSVQDTGIGIEEENLERIFQSFYQEEKYLSRREGGSGLGLAIIHDIIRMMEGTIEVFSSKGKGSTFRVVLPFEYPVDDRPEREGTLENNKRMLVKNPSILLAEDDSANQQLLARIADRQSWRLEITDNGREAVNLASEREYDLLLMDIQLPGMDGIEAIRQIRSKGNSVPIIAITAFALKKETDKMISAGADSHLSKPFTMNQLLDKIYSILTD